MGGFAALVLNIWLIRALGFVYFEALDVVGNWNRAVEESLIFETRIHDVDGFCLIIDIRICLLMCQILNLNNKNRTLFVFESIHNSKIIAPF